MADQDHMTQRYKEILAREVRELPPLDRRPATITVALCDATAQINKAAYAKALRRSKQAQPPVHNV